MKFRFFILLTVVLVLASKAWSKSVSPISGKVTAVVCTQRTVVSKPLPDKLWLIRAYANRKELMTDILKLNTHVQMAGEGVLVDIREGSNMTPLRITAATVRHDCPRLTVTYREME